MANLAQSAVVINDYWMEGGTSSRKFKSVDATLTLTGQGGTTNKILAALFGLSQIFNVRAARDSNNNIISAAPSYDNKEVLLNQQVVGATKSVSATGLASAGNITTAGVLASDTLLSVTDLTTPAAISKSNFTPGAGVIAQASGAGDLHTKTLLFTLQAASAGPTDMTGTVRLIVTGAQ